MDRRQFLRHLVAYGAAVSLPIQIDSASAAEVEVAISKIDQHPMRFSVDPYGYICDTDQDEPEFRWQVYHSIEVKDLKTIDDMLDLNEAKPIGRRFDEQADICLRRTQEAIAGELGAGERRRLKKILKALSDPDDMTENWIRMEGRNGLDSLRAVVAEWLAGEIDGDDYDWFEPGTTQSSSSKMFFEGLDRDILTALRISIINGCHPGSSYQGAKLHVSPAAANAVAKDLGLPFRFFADGAP